MKNTPIVLLHLFLAVLLLESCGKYEDGPAISLRSRTNRVTGLWSMNNAEIDGQNITSFYSTFDVNVREDNSYSQTTALLLGGSETLNGTWRFVENDEVLRVDYDNSFTLFFNILRLSNSEFWVEFEATTENLGVDSDDIITSQPIFTVRLEFTKQDD